MERLFINGEEAFPSLQSALMEVVGNYAQIEHVQRVFGGDTSDCFKVRTSKNSFFVKMSPSSPCRGMLRKEAKALKRMHELELPTPRVHGTWEDDTFQSLVQEFCLSKPPDQNMWEELGRQVARMHDITSSQFGWRSDNFIATLRQDNSWEENALKYFVRRRIQPMRMMANRFLDADDSNRLISVEEKLLETGWFFKPSLIHGDLWSGNILPSRKEILLIDPSISFGIDEMDLSMMKLFGGFPDEFFDSYLKSRSFNSDWIEKIPLWNLYPLLVHVILFGQSYLPQLRKSIKMTENLL